MEEDRPVESAEKPPAKYRRPALHCPRRAGYKPAAPAPSSHKKPETQQRPSAEPTAAQPSRSHHVRPNRLRPLRNQGWRSAAWRFSTLLLVPFQLFGPSSLLVPFQLFGPSASP